MPAGCDFLCDNVECKYHKGGFVITGAWELGDIDLVINSPVVEDNKEHQDGMKRLKERGRKYACINYPNFSEIPTAGYRLHRFCTKCMVLWTYDAMLSEDNDTLEKAEAALNIPEECPKCGDKMFDFQGLLEEGVECPHCHEEMKQSRWCSSAGVQDIVAEKERFERLLAEEEKRKHLAKKEAKRLAEETAKSDGPNDSDEPSKEEAE